MKPKKRNRSFSWSQKKDESSLKKRIESQKTRDDNYPLSCNLHFPLFLLHLISLSAENKKKHSQTKPIVLNLMGKKCDLCEGVARMYCESDQASLCWNCDAKVHGANFLVAKHTRCLLCSACQSPTPWKATGLRLGPTFSVCDSCVALKSAAGGGAGVGTDQSQEVNESQLRRRDDDDGDSAESYDDGEDEDEDEEYSDEDEEEDDADDEEAENQVVPWSAAAAAQLPPVMSSSSSNGGGGDLAAKRTRDYSDVRI